MLTEVIGKTAMLEQTAEECIELAHACLKLSRHNRGENKVYKSVEDMYANLCEEMADVYICIDELIDSDIVSKELVNIEISRKKERMKRRLSDKEY